MKIIVKPDEFLKSCYVGFYAFIELITNTLIFTSYYYSLINYNSEYKYNEQGISEK